MRPFKYYIFLIILIFPIAIIGSWFYFSNIHSSNYANPSQPSTPTSTPKPLLKYTFPNLKNTPPQPSQIQLHQILDQQEKYSASLFSYQSEGKRITGQINLPQISTPSAGFPVVVMLRGWVDPIEYQTGMGTKNAAGYFSSNNFVTLAPDFLGYGNSDDPDPDVFSERLQKPYQVINLISSLSSLIFVNTDQIFLWGHSNGGQIALSVLELTDQVIPTTLWAPVSKPFPYSILYYTDEYDDFGKALRLELAQFEKDYDTFEFSIDQYFDWIRSPLQIHQGTYDDAVPVSWSNELVDLLQELEIDINYYRYPGADHNLRPDWNQVVARDLAFFNSFID